LIHFDAWASTFGETVTAIELAPEGTGYRAKTRFARFYNLPELMMMFREVADVQTADMLNLPVPKANYHNIVLKPSEMQKEMVSELSDRAERVRNKMVDSSVDNMLMITNDGRKLALDQRLMNDILPDDENSKCSACADNAYEIWQKTADRLGTQMIFCDLSTPHNDGKFNVYDDIRDKLIAKAFRLMRLPIFIPQALKHRKKRCSGRFVPVRSASCLALPKRWVPVQMYRENWLHSPTLTVRGDRAIFSNVKEESFVRETKTRRWIYTLLLQKTPLTVIYTSLLRVSKSSSVRS
jgi:hypothetical protein